jgi:antitoxin component YwqK of YwqJK toxin-antitoxin module
MYYKNGKEYGARRSFSPDGRLTFFSWTDSACNSTISTNYYENGMVQSNSFYMDGTLIRTEYFEKDGCLKQIFHDCQSNTNPEYYSDDSLVHGRFNGHISRTYAKGKFELVYEDNEITRWKYYDSGKGKYMIQYPPEE